MTKILFLAANPLDTDQLRLGEEMRAIDNALQQAHFRDQFEIESHWAVRVDDLQALLLRHQPDIVHFSGHGSDASEIILQDAECRSVIVPSGALSRLFRVLRENIRCVLLNACYSADQADAIAAEIDTVIGMSDAISDDAARSFAAAFYRALGYGRSVATAFELGCNAINLAALDEGDKPVLLGRVDAKAVHFSNETRGAKGEGRVSPWWKQLAAESSDFPFEDLIDDTSGDVIVVNVGAGSKNVAIGKNIQQNVTELVGEPTPDDKTLIQQSISSLIASLDDTQRQQVQFPIQLLEAELLKIGEDETPSGSTIKQAGDFLLNSLPSIHEALASLFAQPAVARVLGKAGPETLEWLQQNFG